MIKLKILNNFENKHLIHLKFIGLFFLFISVKNFAQLPDIIYMQNIKSVQLNMYGNQMSLAILNLNDNNQIELNFDDLDGNVKNYYYTLQLCDYNWIPVDLNPFLYIKGFTQQRINTYRYSSIALTKYTHYQAMIPDRNTTLTMSGNYILKVFLDGDTSKLAFTKRLLVLNQKAAIGAKVVQPFSPQIYQTHQKIFINANIKGLNSFSASQQIKVVVLQNNRWDNAKKDITPTFVRGDMLEYSSENNNVFEAGKEWRWLDLRSFSLQSDRVDHADYNKTSTNIYLKPDVDKSAQKYIYYKDFNGMFSIQTLNNINSYWQSDYATVHFYFAPPNGLPYANNDIYLAGQFTNYQFNDNTKMIFNADKNVYECTALLKQGYYNYTFIAVDKTNFIQNMSLEGNYWETENNYTILMYYKSFTDRADELIGVSQINSRTDKVGFSF